MDSLLHTGLLLAAQKEGPGTFRLREQDNHGFADVKATKQVNGTATVTNLHRSVLSRIAFGPDMEARFREKGPFSRSR